MKKILIMGGNQFVGKRLCEVFLERGYEVYALNRGTRNNLPKVKFLKCNRNIEKDLYECLENIQVDYIVDISAYNADQVSLIQKVMAQKYKQYIFISSASIYNEMENLPAKESDSTGINEIWGKYAEDKYQAENKIIENSKKLSFKYTIFRPFYIYGPENNLERESYIFARLENNMPIFIPNEGKEVIQFGYIDDLCDAINFSLDNPEFFNQIFNISGNQMVSIKKYVDICAEICYKEPDIRFINLKERNLKARDWFPFRNVNLIGDISKIEKAGFKNKYLLQRGLEKIYLYLKENKKLDKLLPNEIENSFYEK